MKTFMLVLAVGACLGIAGGAGASRFGPPISSQTAEQIVAAAAAAADNARSVHVSGSASRLKFNLYLVAGKGGRGRITQNGLTFDLIRIGTTAYFKGSDKFWSRYAGPAAVQLFHGRWMSASATKGDLASLTPLTDLRKLLDSALSSHGKLAKSGSATINGQAAFGVRDTTQGGTLYVATSGTPFPIAIKKAGSSGGTIDFDRWNQTISLTAPPNPIDIAKLKKK